MILTGETEELGEKPVLGANPVLSSERPAPNCLNRGMALTSALVGIIYMSCDVAKRHLVKNCGKIRFGV
jgi:hypothetical protein